MEEIHEIVSKIELWINDEYGSTFEISREEDYDGNLQPFLLKITCSDILGQKLPVSIFKPTEYKNKLGVYSGIEFNDEERKSFNALELTFRDKIISELYNGLSIMGLIVKFIPDQKNFNQIAFQDRIYFDGISQDRVLNSLNKIIIAYSYIVSVLKEHNILKRSFDTSNFT
jgi:hypothetical protein